MDTIRIDGSQGEGGGQILRSSLAMSLATGRPFEIEKIRALRKRPGLLRQHLTAVEAAKQIGRAEVEGAAIGSSTLRFRPTAVAGGSYEFAIGTAGSTTLVIQAILPALLGADRPTTVRVEGGTHNPFAPPFDFLDRCYLPLLRKMGAEVELKLERAGFYPAGGGAVTLEVNPIPALRPLDLLERGEERARRAVVWLSALPDSIGEREAEKLAHGLRMELRDIDLRRVVDPIGPGNVVLVEIESEQVTELFTGFGQIGVPAERVAKAAIRETRQYLTTSAPVGPYLADQLLLPLALAGGGSFRTMAPTKHTHTQVAVIEQFLPIRIRQTQNARHDYLFEVLKAEELRAES